MCFVECTSGTRPVVSVFSGTTTCKSGTTAALNAPTVRSALGAINTPPPTLGQGARCIEDYYLHFSHQIAKISSLHHPKSLIFGELKEEALIYYFTKRDLHFPLIHLRAPISLVFSLETLVLDLVLTSLSLIVLTSCWYLGASN